MTPKALLLLKHSRTLLALGFLDSVSLQNRSCLSFFRYYQNSLGTLIQLFIKGTPTQILHDLPHFKVVITRVGQEEEHVQFS